MLTMDPFKKSYASITAMELTEATSLPLDPQLHHLLLTELGITDIQSCKGALSDPETFTYDQVLSDPDIEEWKKSAHMEIPQLESKETWVEVPPSEATSKVSSRHMGIPLHESSHRNHNQVQGKRLSSR